MLNLDFSEKSLGLASPPHFDETFNIYDQAYCTSLQKLKPIQYNSTLAITGVIRGTSREELYYELGF